MKIQQVNLSVRLNWQLWASIFGLLYYLPYYFKNMLNWDTAQLTPILRPIQAGVKFWLLLQARPIAGFDNFLSTTFSYELLTFMGVVIFIVATIKFVELVLPRLNSFFKLLVFLLLFVNPFIYIERGWSYQFFVQSLITVFYYISFYAILKYKENHFNLAKLFWGYLWPIGSLLIGLNYFMPSFFHFIILCMVMVLKRHTENSFLTIAEVIYYAKDFLIIVFFGGLIYVIEINLGWYLLDSSLAEYHKQVGRRSNLDLKERLINIHNLYNMLFNYVGVVFTAILLLSKRNAVGLFLFFMVGLVCASSYFFYLVLDMRSTSILQFPNYYLTFYIAGLLLVKYQNNLKPKLLKCVAVLAMLFLCYFYFSSYYYYNMLYQHHKQVYALVNNINNYVIKTYNTNTPPIKLVSSYNVFKIAEALPKSKIVFFNTISLSSFGAFQGALLGLPHIKSYIIWGANIKSMAYIKDDYLRAKCLELVKVGKIFPHPESVFLYKGVYHVIN